MRLAPFATLPAALLLALSTAAQQTGVYSHVSAPLRTAAAERKVELPVTRVSLYKNGVGFFEHAGRVTGNQSVTIDFSDDEVRAIHADGLGMPSPNSPQSINELLAALLEVRRRGWEEADDEAIPGVGSISVSVADPKLRESIGFCISYPAFNISTEEKHRIIALLTAAAHRIASRFDDPFFSHLMHVVPDTGSVAA